MTDPLETGSWSEPASFVWEHPAWFTRANCRGVDTDLRASNGGAK